MNSANNKKTAQALIVDDEADIRALLEITLGRMGVAVTAASDLEGAKAAFDSGGFDLCLTDMRLPDGEGIELVRHIKAHASACPVAIITAYGSAATAVASLKAGAFDFISKPVDVTQLRALVAQALKLTGQNPNAPRSRPSGNSLRLVGETRSIAALRRTIRKLARSQAPTFITGESGTGKERIARMIHAEGLRSKGEFVPVNCGAIPPELMESECFGHVRGAFTGAIRDTPGLFTRADGGTLFLDEITDLPMAMQVKLLRAIQERAIRPVGAAQELPVDIRILSASHRDLAGEVARGHFREDLYYRLNVIEVRVPPLRERRDDIPLLATELITGLAAKLQLDPVPELATDALSALMDYDFPGNVRELENILERAMTLAEAPIIRRQYLRLSSPFKRAMRSQPIVHSGVPAPVDEALDLASQLKAVEHARIQTALEACRYNKTKTAERLGISFRALRYRLDKLGIG